MYFSKYLNKKNVLLAVIIKMAVLAISLLLVFGGNLISMAHATYGIDSSVRQVRTAESSTVYFLDHARGLKKAYINADAYLMYGNRWSDVKIVSQESLDQWPDMYLVKSDKNSAVYYIHDFQKILIKSEADFIALGLNWADVVTIKQEDLDFYPAVGDYDTIKKTYNPLAVGIGRVEVALDTASPTYQYIPLDTKNNTIGIFDMTASKGTAVINSITITLRGVFSDQELADLKITDENDVPYDTLYSLNGREAIFMFFNAPLTLNSGDKKKINVVADINGTPDSANHSIQAVLASSKFLETDAYVDGQFPISARTIFFTSSTGVLGSASVQESSLGISNYLPQALVGATDQLIGKFRVTETSNREALKINELRFVNNGSAKYTDLVNFKLRDSANRVIATVNAMTSDKLVTFKLKSFEVKKGSYADFMLTADIADGDGRSFDIDLDDFKIIGSNYGYSVPVDYTPFFEQISITRESLGLVSLTLRPNTKVFANQTGVILASFEVRNGSKRVTLDQLGFTLDKNSAAPQLGAIYAVNYDTGEVLGSANGANLNGVDNSLYLSKTVLEPQRGIKICFVTDIPDQAKNGDYYNVVIKRLSYFALNNLYYDDTFNVPGVRLNVSRANLYIYSNVNEPSYVYTKGQKGVKIGSFILEAAAGDDVVINSVVLTNGNDTSGMLTYENGFKNLRITVNGSSPSNTIASPMGGSYIFDGLKATVYAGRRAEIRVYVDTDPNLAVSQSQLMLVKIVASSAKSGIASTINHINVNGAKTTYGNIQATMTALSGGIASAGTKGNVVASFKVKNSGDESIALKTVIVETSADGFSNSLGYSNLRIVNREKGFTVGNLNLPVAGANTLGLGNFRLDTGTEATFDVYVDASPNIFTDQFDIFFRDLSSYGRTSNIKSPVVGDPTAGMSFVSSGVGFPVDAGSTGNLF